MLVLLLVPSLIWGIVGGAQPYDERQVKAAFLNKLPMFVKWPEAYQPSDHVVIGFLGMNPLKPFIKEIEGQGIKGKKVVTKQILSVREARQCHMVFIGSSERDRLGYILSALSSLPVLTVSDSEGWAKQGIMVNFYEEQGMIRFEVNVDAAKNAGLVLSSQLLKLARIVR